MNKVNVSYVPHGINPNVFYPVDKINAQFLQFRQKIIMQQQFDMIIFFNSRNINRKHVSDLIIAYKIFANMVPDKDKILLLLHTDLVDQFGTDLQQIIQKLLGSDYPCFVN